ncbi:MAG TPA: hypothetical protein VLA48_07945, partial [Nitrososphaeraceae archaeon]|nr:hypothetical protein [Nitrososphaeraceae archaeon]
MNKQKNLPYQIGIIVFLFVMSTVMVTSSPFQMLSDVNPDFESNLSFKIANASTDNGDGGDGGGNSDGGDFFDNSDGGGNSDGGNSEEDISERSFDSSEFSFAQSEDAEDVDQEITEDVEQVLGQQGEQDAEDAEDVEQVLGQQGEQDAEDAEDVEQVLG